MSEIYFTDFSIPDFARRSGAGENKKVKVKN